jgi:hypothetical protein
MSNHVALTGIVREIEVLASEFLPDLVPEVSEIVVVVAAAMLSVHEPREGFEVLTGGIED